MLSKKAKHRNKLLLYSDAPVFGGHEVMVLNALRRLLTMNIWEIGIVYCCKNKKLGSELEQLKNIFPELALYPNEYASGRLQYLRTFWSFRAKRRIRSLFNDLSPDLVLAVQGEISLSSVGVLSAKDVGCYTVSYLPMAHTRKQRGEKLSWLKDYVLRYYYQLPDHFITISKSVLMQIRNRGADQPIEIVENGISMDKLEVLDKKESRTQLGIKRSSYIAALCGRIEFKQKGHDILLKALAGHIDDFREWTFLIVGTGPDQDCLEKMIVDKGLADIVQLVPWQANMSVVYSAIDMLIMPSLYEGVPVIMLEGMYYRLPIIGSDIDAMRELLPPEWIFPPQNEKLLCEKMLQVRSQNTDCQREKNYGMVTERFVQEQQEQEFEQVLNNCIGLNKGY